MRLKNNDFTTVATKISRTDKTKLVYIANTFGMTFYELLKSLLLALIRYFDKDTDISEEFGQMMEAFATVIKSNNSSFNPLSLKNRHKMSVNHAIIFAQNKKDHIPQVIAIGRDSHGKLTENYNIDTMLSEFLQSCDPQTLKALEREKKEMGFFSLGQTLREVVARTPDRHKADISQEVKTLFDDIRVPTGIKLNNDIYYKRKVNRGYVSQTSAQNKYVHADL